ncbi:neuroblast differentiation-associated protein AHNAK isoform X1 [Haloferula helveola]|uniref:Neuroblast differentiation-associated protein AHNAK isoform X1 n=1 Tax=Haloferula helveola TaxID=490095 RepID=A0ABN6H300_9BACT|nr:neuroblast differentiation-associated protein AHNAK isoform X1 [Haloferula helveola]
MKTNVLRSLTLIPVSAFALSIAACDVDKVEDGELPEVKIEGETKLPKYEVEGPDVTVEKEKVEIEVPKVKIDLPEEEDNEQPATEPDAEPAPDADGDSE